MTDFLGFWFRVILNLYGMTSHPVVVLGLEHDFLFKSAATYCAWELVFFWPSFQKIFPKYVPKNWWSGPYDTMKNWRDAS
jgi:hypothetical protein